MKDKPQRQTVTLEQLSYSNMLTLNALVELLTEKGVLIKPEILERIKKLQTETKVSPTMNRFAPGRTRSCRGCLLAASVFSLLWPCRTGFGWGREGHQIVGLIAGHYMTDEARAKTSDLLDGSTIDGVASWADDYRRDHPETGPWHYIDIPLADSQIDLSKECPNGDCVVVKTEQFVAVLRDPKADRRAKADALKYVVHFVGDLHQPLHDEDDNDKGGNRRRVIFDGRPDNLHWIWDTGLLEHINRNQEALSMQLESRITPQDREKWVRGGIKDWALEGHRLAQSVAYGDLTKANPAPITPAYEQQADPVIELQLEKAGVRLAFVLDKALQ